MIYRDNLLQAERVYLTAIRRDDLDMYKKWHSNPEFLRLKSGGVAMPRTQERYEQWLDAIIKDKETYYFGIRLREDDRLLGNCDIEMENPTSRHGWVGIFIGDPDDWGKGYGTEAMSILVRFGFMELNLHRITLNVFAYNERGIKSYEKVGFVHEGTNREALYRDGTYYDVHLMGILRRDWLMKHHPDLVK
ncbi:MAG: GNAT family N-acetyltransferase [Anaerolineae bacterium]|jgi:RimJ/RimL family protein N-acetyltransferase|nr:GNAT family N-acetyltransferase [Anaerolineae bacterium]